MNKGSKILFIVLLVVVLLCVVNIYANTVVYKKFQIFTSEEDIPSYPAIIDVIREKITP